VASPIKHRARKGVRRMTINNLNDSQINMVNKRLGYNVASVNFEYVLRDILSMSPETKDDEVIYKIACLLNNKEALARQVAQA
jgi:hypothetical protein